MGEKRIAICNPTRATARQTAGLRSPASLECRPPLQGVKSAASNRSNAAAMSLPPTSEHGGPIFPDLAKDVVLERSNQLWVADLTYVAIPGGFVYLAAILDAWSRKAIGYTISRSMAGGNTNNRESRMAVSVEWEIKATEFANCNCIYACPCQFNALPDKGFCEAVAGFQIHQGTSAMSRSTVCVLRGSGIGQVRCMRVTAACNSSSMSAPTQTSETRW